MYILLSLLLIFLALTIHELGHAWAMIQCGVDIAEISFGIPIPKTPQLNLVKTKKNGGKTKIRFSWFILAAYVKPSAKGIQQMENLPLKSQCYIYGAGVIGNLVLGAVIVVAHLLTQYGLQKMKAILICLGIALVLIIFRKFFARYFMPVLGILMIGILFYSVQQAPLENLGGPITIVKMTTENSNLADSLYFGLLITLSLAMMNSLPLFPLDGGRVVDAILKKWKWEKAGTAYEIIAGVWIVLLIAAILLSDIIKLFI